ncbi:MAG: FimV/HubP family polar landmark protein [Aquabacterium sp.]
MKDHPLSAGNFSLHRVAVAALLSGVALLPASAWALGLGRLNVQSALGESLRAEIDVTSLTAEEAASLQVRVASPETYSAAGVDYNAVLSATTISLQRRADGRPFLRISSDRSVQEPFVDVILDLAWSSGRLVREYTLLFDPPAARAAAPVTPPAMTAPAVAPAPVAVAPKPTASAPAPVAVAPAPAPAVTTPPARPVVPTPVAVAPKPAPSAPEPAASEPAPRPVAQTPMPAPAPAPKAPQMAASESAAEGDRQVRVRRGDTLSRIAQKEMPDGVSLDQMLVGLYRSNPQAFSGNNMNRLKSGVVLSVPSTDELRAVSQPEARRIIQAQSADFSAYRQRLAEAAGTAAQAQPERQASGKVEAEVKDRQQAAVTSPDKLTLSKGGMTAQKGAAAEDKLAQARAQKEEAARVAELNRNLEELRKVREKAEADKAAAAKAAADKAAAEKLAAEKAAADKLAAEKLAAEKAAAEKAAADKLAAEQAAAKAAAAAASAASAPASAVVIDMAASEAAVTQTADAASDAASEVAQAPSLPVPAPVAPPAPVAEEEPGFLQSLNPMLLAGAGAGVALLAGLAMFLRSRRRSETGETSFLESRLQPDSFFGASGGQRVDTRDATGGPSSMSYSLSQLDAIGDVDPVAEADVYLAYGRDLQAEEILKEALRSNPERLAIRTKLLEVYAKRRDTKGFEALATQLYQLTGGVGEDWARAQELGMGIDPENPLYQPGGQPPVAALAAAATAAEPLGASTVPHSVMPTPSTLDTFAPTGLEAEPAAAPAPMTSADLSDVDLDISAPAPLDAVTDSVSPPITEAGSLPELRTDLPELGGAVAETAPAVLDAPAESPRDDSASLDFDLTLDEPAPVAPAAPAEPNPASSFDFGSISLDLDEPGKGEPGGEVIESSLMDVEPDTASGQLDQVSDDPMVRKFELAEEFRQIGDVDGARELLQEVVDTATDAALKAKAQAMLDNLA